MFCIKCGQELLDNAVFCSKCGQRVLVNQSDIKQNTEVSGRSSGLSSQFTENGQGKDINTGGTVNRKKSANGYLILLAFLLIIIGGTVYYFSKGIISFSGKTSYDMSGDYIVFGTYEQDGDYSNGSEPIEWEILNKDNKGYLLVSRYILDCQPYNTKGTDVTWETCSLRSWLNSDFYDIAFSDEEKEKIREVELKNFSNMYGGKYASVDGGNKTHDKVFCLSVDEISQYYSFDSSYSEDKFGKNSGYCQKLITPLTVYADYQGVYTDEINYDEYQENYNAKGYTTDCISCEGGIWWLRTPSESNNMACVVSHDGGAGYYFFGLDVDQNIVGVRPAIYVKK